MILPKALRTALLLSISALVAAAACTGETIRVAPSPSQTPAATVPAASTRPSTPTPTPTRAPTASAATSSASPGAPGTPPAACPPLTGGSPLAASVLTDIRAAHLAGVDRLVFEWSGPVVPQYEIRVATSFVAPSGAVVPVDGNARISVRMSGQAHTGTSPATKSYPEPDPYRPGLPLIREVRSIEDFEGTVVFGVGLERLACPSVLTLVSPSRIVLDFPAP